MPPSSPIKSHLRKVHGALRRLRCWILPPRDSVFIDGCWREAVPVQEGPAIATFGDREIPQYWVLECGRVAEFVGIYDGRTLFSRQPPTQPGELIIGQGIYRVSVRPRSLCASNDSVRAA